ncbi:hypothetical protein Tco_0103439 [Tanacetum coccineum]
MNPSPSIPFVLLKNPSQPLMLLRNLQDCQGGNFHGVTVIVEVGEGKSIDRYALFHNPTIYDSLVKQFWQTATVKTLANGIQELVASIDNKEYTITEASIRSQLQLVDATGITNLPDAKIYRGFVTFGSDPKGGKITGKGKIRTANLDFNGVYFVDELKFNLFSVSQMCDKKNSVLFTDIECLILSPSFKLLDESQVVLKAPRQWVKLLEVALKRKSIKVILSESEDEEIEDQGRKIQDIDDDPLVSLNKKNQIRQEEAGLAEAMRLQALQDEEDARQVHLDALLAKRIQEEQELYKQQQKRKAEVQEAAQFYTEED